MPIQQKYLADLVEDKIYHVYNRTNNNELMFRSEQNRKYFLENFDYYLSPYLDTYCWSLLPNHFHFLVRIKSASAISKWLLRKKIIKPKEHRYLLGKDTSAGLLKTAFQQFFTSYAMSFNEMYDRKGNFFQRPYKRVEIFKDDHFTNAVVYIHRNAVKHNLVSDFSTYPWSSWQTLLSDAPCTLLREELLDWFGGREKMIAAHQNPLLITSKGISIED